MLHEEGSPLRSESRRSDIDPSAKQNAARPEGDISRAPFELSSLKPEFLKSLIEERVEAIGGTLFFVGAPAERDLGLGQKRIGVPIVTAIDKDFEPCIRLGLYFTDNEDLMFSKQELQSDIVAAIKGLRVLEHVSSISRETLDACLSLGGAIGIYGLNSGERAEIDGFVLDEIKAEVGFEKVQTLLDLPLPNLDSTLTLAQERDIEIKAYSLLQALENKLLADSPQVRRKCDQLYEQEFLVFDLNEVFLDAYETIKEKGENASSQEQDGEDQEEEDEREPWQVAQDENESSESEEAGIDLDYYSQLAIEYLELAKPVVEWALVMARPKLRDLGRTWSELSAVIESSSTETEIGAIKIGRTEIDSKFIELNTALSALRLLDEEDRFESSEQFVRIHEQLLTFADALHEGANEINSLALLCGRNCTAPLEKLESEFSALRKTLNCNAFHHMRGLFALGEFHYPEEQSNQLEAQP